MTPEIQPISSELVAEVAELAGKVYATGRMGEIFADPRRTVARWEWLGRNPIGGAPAWVALADHRVIGHVGTLPVEVAHGQRTICASWARDLLVHVDARGMGVGSALIRTAVAESGHLFLGGMNPGVRRMYARLGYIAMGGIPLYVRPVTLDGIAAALHWPGPVVAAARSAQMIRRTLRRPRRRSTTTVRTIDAFDERFDAWWAELEQRLDCVVRRTSATMNWRYRTHPEHRYTLLEATDKRGIRGVAVTRPGTTRGLRTGLIVELLARPDDADAIHDLISVSLDVLERESPLLVRCNLTHGTFARHLIRSGFLPAPTTFHWMRAETPEMAGTIDLCRRWTLGSGDSDLDAI